MIIQSIDKKNLFYIYILVFYSIAVYKIDLKLKMPTINIKRDLLFEALGTTYSNYFRFSSDNTFNI